MKKIFLLFLVVTATLLVLKNTRAEQRVQEGFVEPDKLRIISADFAADPYSKANYDSFLKIRVYNESRYDIVRAFIRFKLVCDNGTREVFSERFEKVISGGMPAYSSQVWLFYPRNASFWAMHNIPYDAEIVATVEKVFCPKKNSPWQYEHEFKYPSRHDMYY